MFTKPAKITANHDLTKFSCGNSVLDGWLISTALKNQRSAASTTYLVCQQEMEQVAGYFCLSAGSIIRSVAPKRISRNQPDLIPVMLLGRLAVDKNYGGIGMGRNLFASAYQISLDAASLVGIRALLVHAIDDEAKSFWTRLGFVVSPMNPLTLILKLTIKN